MLLNDFTIAVSAAFMVMPAGVDAALNVQWTALFQRPPISE